MKKIIEVIDLGTEYLNKHEVEDARLNMQLILCSVLNLNKIDLYTQFDKPLHPQEIETIRSYMIKRAEGVPLQYILNAGHFLDLKLELSNSVLIPRPETEELVALVDRNNLANKDERISVLDIGTGGGCIALSLAKLFPNAEVFAVDIDQVAINTATINAENNSLNSIKFHKFDILNQIPKSKFDIIVSNPPYISLEDYHELEQTVRKFEPRAALTDEADGLTFYRRFADIFQNMLKPNGKFYLEIGFGQSEQIISIFPVTKYAINVSKDSAGIDRIIEGQLIC